MSARFYGRWALVFVLFAVALFTVWMFGGGVGFWILGWITTAISFGYSLHYLAALARESR